MKDLNEMSYQELIEYRERIDEEVKRKHDESLRHKANKIISLGYVTSIEKHFNANTWCISINDKGVSKEISSILEGNAAVYSMTNEGDEHEG